MLAREVSCWNSFLFCFVRVIRHMGVWDSSFSNLKRFIIPGNDNIIFAFDKLQCSCEIGLPICRTFAVDSGVFELWFLGVSFGYKGVGN